MDGDMEIGGVFFLFFFYFLLLFLFFVLELWNFRLYLGALSCT